MANAIEINNLTKKYGRKVALDGVDLTITGGKIVGLLGPNGSGKSTLFKCLTGLLAFDGSAKIYGEEVGVKTKSIVSYLPERTYLDMNMTAKEVFDTFKTFYKDFDIVRAYELLATLKVEKDVRLKTLSKGTKEKIQLIAVMARKAKVYLLDEPIGGVDPAAREFIINTILTRVNEGSTIVISTHLIRDIEDILDEYVFINGSKIVSCGNVKDVHSQGKTVDEEFREVFRCL
ncbi:MAG: ABC transporter ATP-binding protein [Clostridia bacterium]|nr:ABC transporter ATP-binding protein [Clostridia bacterium]